MRYKIIFFSTCAACSLFMQASAIEPMINPFIQEESSTLRRKDVKIEFVDEASDEWSSIFTLSEMLHHMEILFKITENECALQLVQHKDKSEVKLAIDYVRQANMLMMRQSCQEDDQFLFFKANTVIASRLFLLSHYGFIELSDDDEKELYASLRDKSEREIFVLLSNFAPSSVNIAESGSAIRLKWVYYFPACWMERMRDLTLNVWASRMKYKIQSVLNQEH